MGASFIIFKEFWTTLITKTINNRFYNFKKIKAFRENMFNVAPILNNIAPTVKKIVPIK